MTDYLIEFDPLAEQDLEGAADWYEEASPGLGAEFILNIDEQLQKFRKNPELGTPIEDNLRRALSDRFPYAIYFEVHESKIRILAILHVRREPGLWKERRE